MLCAVVQSHAFGEVHAFDDARAFGETTGEREVNNHDPETPVAEPVRVAEKLTVFPDKIQLSHLRDHQSIVAQIHYNDGVTEDVSAQLEINIQDENIARWSNNLIHAVADGETLIELSHSGMTFTMPVSVTDANSQTAISFKNDIVPIFSKVGCNAGSCHGAARGKDGFRLSLYGFDPDGDYFRIAREMPGRRIDLALPEDCLLLSKANGEVSHSGGSLIKRDSDFHQTILKWLREGGKNDTGPIPTVKRIELYPNDGLLNGTGSQQQMMVQAIYSDGTDRDVTNLSYFLTNNDNSAIVNADGMVTAQKPGEAFVTARFGAHTVGVPFVVVAKDAQFAWNDEPENNFIDLAINKKLKQLRILPSGICTDQEFIRRASIDICGIVPTAEQVLQFVDNSDSDKRSQLIDQLLQRKEFVDIWVMKWSELLQIRSLQNRVSYKAALLYYSWLQDNIANDVPADQMIRELLSSEGGTFTSAATNYYQNERDNLKIAENVAQVFMGIRIQCAQCHNHPFDRWTMDDYFSFVAFFSQLSRKRGEDPREMIVFDRGRGETKHPVTGSVMKPKFLGGDYPITKGKDRRVVLADWLASEQNPYFANNLANIIWSHFLGRGIIDEVDDVRVSNPAVNQPLLDELGTKLKEYQYDFKKLIRDICNSRTYQRRTAANESNENDLTNFSHASLRRIRAEVLLDVISQITETKNKFRGLPLGAKAVQIADGNTSTYFLSTFGRAKRETVCSCEVKVEPNLSQALHLINGDTINKKIRQGKLIKRLSDAGYSDQEIIDEIYLRCLSRTATEAESESLLSEISLQKDKIAALEDVFWAVLNSREFVFNH